MSGNRNQSESGGSKTNWGGWADVMAAVQESKGQVDSTKAATAGVGDVDVANIDTLSCVDSYSDEGEEPSSPVGRGRYK